MILEVLLALIVLVILLVAIIQFAIALAVQQTVRAAATEAAREGAKVAGQGGSTAEIRDEVLSVLDDFLAVHGLSTTNNVRAALKFRRGAVLTGLPSLGDTVNVASCPAPADFFFPFGGEDRLGLSVCVLASRSGRPVPNLLSAFGLDITEMRFDASSLTVIP